MKMTKNTMRGLIIGGIFLVIFNLIAFLVPFPRNGVFWTGFIFGVIAILAQALIWSIAFKGAESARSKFYGVPIARIGTIYLIVQLILSLIAMFLAWVQVIPAWPFILVFLIIIGVVALDTIAADVTRDEIERQDVQIKRDVSNMRELQSLGKSLTALCDDAATKEELQKLSDALVYSDPVSSEATAASEAELKRLLTELQTALFDGDTSGATGLCKQAQGVLAERNRICKLNK